MRMLHEKPELLAPAGDETALQAAVRAGADAVYLGFRSFGARAAAVNFDGEGLARAVEYAHTYHVRVYVTMNTLVKERELPEVEKALETIAMARADAVIVQDVGVAALARRHFPTLALHASTQMGIHNAQGARWARRLGMERAVLARECPLSEIARVAETGVETEVFVHGALCSGVSGQCLMSSMAGGRSGNRGRCAQPCRQDLRMEGRSGALLSLRDLYLRDQLADLWQAGVRALKIEGRLKRPEYVAVVTDSYRRALEEIGSGRFAPGDAKEREWLMQAFHRGGFTKGHAFDAQDAALCETGHAGHGGVPLGQVVRIKNGLATLRLTRSLRDGDSLQLRGKTETDLRYSGKDREAGEEAILRLRGDAGAAAGDEAVRLADVGQLEWARGLREKPIAVTLTANLAQGKPFRLALSDGSQTVTVEGDVAQPAKTRAVTEEEIRRQLQKLGDTPFFTPTDESISIEMEQGLFLPLGAVNAVRREGLEKLARSRAAAFFGPEKEAALEGAKPCATWKTEGPAADALDARWQNTLAVHFRDGGMAGPLGKAGATLLLYEPVDWRKEPLEKSLEALPPGVWLQLPPQTGGQALEEIVAAVRAHSGKVQGVAVGSVGQLGADFPVPVALGKGVPVTNRPALEELSKASPAFFTLWPEWSFSEIWDMLPANLPRLLGVYGRERLMLLGHCPHRVALGLREGRETCALCRGHMACGAEDPALTDRKGYRFPLGRTRLPEGCVVNVYNALPADLRKQEDKRKALGAGMLLSFTNEPPEEQLRLVGEFGALLRGETPPEPLGPVTTGHLLRGVE